MAVTTDAAYNAKSRMVECKLDIYFNGINGTPLSVTKDNYLVTWDVLEEVSADSCAPFATVSANELSFELVNKNDIFNPSNAQGAYYGKIKVGVQVKLYVRPVAATAYDWDQLGTFYLTDWQVGFAGQTVSATATDKVSKIINATRVKLPVYKNIAYNTFIQHFFTKLGMPITLDSALIGTLRYGYHVLQNADFLNNIAGGLQVFIYCDHTGDLITRYMHKTVALAHTITDADQIVEPTTKQSIMLQYDGASVRAQIPQLSNITTLYSESDIENTMLTQYRDRTFSNTPVVNVAYITSSGDSTPYIDGLTYNATEIINFSLRDAFSGRIEFCGQYLQTADVYAEDVGCDNALKFSSIYIQSQAYLSTFKAFMDAYVQSVLPVLEVSVKGNPRFQLGEKIRVQSARFGLDFTGILIRQNLRYDGGLSGTITLLNASILEVSAA